MTNFEKLAQSPTELTNFICHANITGCGDNDEKKYCAYKYEKCGGGGKDCLKGISKWLKQEAEREDEHDEHNHNTAAEL